MSKPQRWMTLDAWNEEGFKVAKGSKSILKSPDGLPLFSESQVEEWEDLDELICDPYTE